LPVVVERLARKEARKMDKLRCPHCGKPEVALEQAARVYYRIPLGEDGRILSEEEEIVHAEPDSHDCDSVSCQACGEFFGYQIEGNRVTLNIGQLGSQRSTL